MPLNALRAVKPDVVASVAELSLFVMTLLDQPVVEKPEASNIQRIAAIETQIASTGRSSVDIIESIGSRSPLTCPECGGVVWRIGDSAPLRYRCHTGHAFSGRSLEEVQRQQTENALWSVVRGLQERLTLAKQQVGQSRRCFRAGSDQRANREPRCGRRGCVRLAARHRTWRV